MFERRRRAAGEPGEQAPDPLGEREVRPHALRRLGRGDVDGERHEVAAQREHDLLRDRLPRLVLRLGGRRAEVRRDDHVVEREQRRLGRRLLRERVDRGTAEAAVGDRGGQRVLVDDAAAARVDQPHARLRVREHRRVDRARPSPASSSRGSRRSRRPRRALRSSARARRRVGGRDRRSRTGRTRRAACRTRARAARRARRRGRGRRCRASCRAARRLPTSSGSTRPPSDRRWPAARCAPARAAARACARPPTGCSTAARSRPSRRGAWPRRRRRCRARSRRGRRRRDRSPASSTSAVTWVALRITSACAPLTASSSCSGRETGLHVDVEAGGAHGVEPALGEGFGDENTRCHRREGRRLRRAGRRSGAHLHRGRRRRARTTAGRSRAHRTPRRERSRPWPRRAAARTARASSCGVRPAISRPSTPSNDGKQ